MKISYEQLMEIPLIDTHIHRVHPNRTPDLGHLGGGYIDGPNQKHNARQTLLYGMIIEQLRQEFGMPDITSAEEIEGERNRRYNIDPIGYYKNLIADQNVAKYLIEVGSPLGGAAYTKEEINYFNSSIPLDKLRTIVRIERAVDECILKKADFKSFLNNYSETMRTQIIESNAVGIKSCAAYFGGLDILISDYADSQKSYEAIIKGEDTSYDQKVLNNFVLMQTVEIAKEFDIPIQFHTGFGGGSMIDFKTMNPIHMIDFLKDKRVINEAKIVLLHGGHPHEAETGYITSQFSNVYTDFSGAFYLSTLRGLDGMAALLERTPLNKVMFGSDGVMFPEISWFATIRFRKLFAKLLNDMMDDECITSNKAMAIAKMIMHDNALGCYSKI